MPTKFQAKGKFRYKVSYKMRINSLFYSDDIIVSNVELDLEAAKKKFYSYFNEDVFEFADFVELGKGEGKGRYSVRGRSKGKSKL